MGVWQLLRETVLSTMTDVLPIVIIIFGFQLVILRQRIPNLKSVLIGFIYVLIGLTLFLVGLQEALFPLGKLMAQQLTNPDFIRGTTTTLVDGLRWYDYKWVYLFAAAIGFATTIAEPALIAVAIGITLGTFRIVNGTPLYSYIITGYIIVVIQTLYAPRSVIALAYDSGGVTTSTVTVPMVAALGLGLATTVPGRSALLDGFGLIAFASLFPMITVMGYAQVGSWWLRRYAKRRPVTPS